MKENKSQPSQKGTSELKKLSILGDTYYTTFTRKYQEKQNWVRPDKKKVISFIPGTVRQILVKPGDKVNADDKLLVLDAMKMLNSIHSPISGIIKSVLVKEGDRLPKGSVMVEFE